jgi:acyl-homoserine lactone acylase PvdQ
MFFASGWEQPVDICASVLSSDQGEVTIYRDDWGVPHIYAKTEEAGFYGLGYAQGEDHLEGILRLFLMVRGELAAAFGTEFVKSDIEQRRWLHVEEAQKGFDLMNPQLQKNYRFYVAGLKRYMKDHPEDVPDWAPKLEAVDVVALSRSVLWTYMIRHGVRDCTRGGIKVASVFREMLEENRRSASNEWIVAPWRTAGDAMIILSDPHGGVDGGLFYEFRMDAGAMKTAGYSFGALFILTHNRHISWGMTTGDPDVSDCYEVEVDPENPRRYQYDGEWQTMETRDVTVVVKDAEPVIRTLEYTRHNDRLSPVIARHNGKAYAICSSYMKDAGLFDEEIYRLNLAKNVAEVKEAVKILGMFPQNLMVGDHLGNSYYVRAGKTPKRPSGFDWNKPVPGNTSKTAWLGIHPVEDLVQIENPPQGYMQNCNIAPDTMMEDCPLTADRYPSYIFNDEPNRANTRGLRAVEVLSKNFHFTVEDAIELALDEKWFGTEAWQAALDKALNQNNDYMKDAKPLFKRFVDNILHFDGHARADSVAALNYLYWRSALWGMSDLNEEDKEALTDPRWEKAELTPAQGEILVKAVELAIKAMLEEHGTIDLRYGDVHRIGRDGKSWPLGGGGLMPENSVACAYHTKCIFTLRAMTFGEPDEHGYRYPWLGSRCLRLVIFTEPLQSFTLHLFGQSGRKESPHYTDQARLASKRRLKPTYFHKEDLLKHVVSKKMLHVTEPEND